MRPERALHGEAALQEGTKVLLVLGTQKGGTSWLARTLFRNPAFVSAKRKDGGAIKEVHYFDSWPLPSFTEWAALYPANVSAGATLVDASASYLYHSWAAARIKRLIPHARFVVLLRDPVARALSAWRMYASAGRAPKTFSAFMLQGMLHAARGQQGCLFAQPDSGTAGSATDWHACYKCQFESLDRTGCANVTAALQQRCARATHRRPTRFGREWWRTELDFPGQVAIGSYAAQLAWWLAFFPVDRFLVVPSAMTHDAHNATVVLNAIRDHMGLHDSQPFTEDDFTGELHTTKKAPPTADEAVASDVLRELYAVPQQRLWTVLRRYGLDTFMHNVDQNLNLPH